MYFCIWFWVMLGLALGFDSLSTGTFFHANKLFFGIKLQSKILNIFLFFLFLFF